MFLDELTPFMREAAGQPLAFLGGFFSGLLQLDLNEDPVKSWLAKQPGTRVPEANRETNGQSKGPKSISIE